MSREVLSVVSGLAVLITGLIAVVSLMGPTDVDAVETLPPPITTAVPDLTAAKPIEGLPGVGPAITRVLVWSGNAGSADDGDLAQLPPSVAALLIEYGAPLLVPTVSGRPQ
jgi:hypothetical protein